MLPKRGLNNVDKHVGSRLRARRLSLGMSQEKLGAAVNLTFQQIQKYEKGTNRVGASRLMQFAIILDVPPKYFFDGAPSPDGMSGKVPTRTDPTADRVTNFLASQNGNAIVMACLELDDSRYVRIVRNFTESLAGAIKLRRA
jgi:transcriptional regulator with XRE-family HTH domain